jgi:response regulator of citrate/malate metabolism
MINTTMKRVENLLHSFPETRDNDRLLVEVYMTFYHGIKTLHEYRKTSEAPPIETITR